MVLSIDEYSGYLSVQAVSASIRYENIIVLVRTLERGHRIFGRTPLDLYDAKIIVGLSSGAVEKADDAACPHVKEFDRARFVVNAGPEILPCSVVNGLDDVLASSVAFVEYNLSHTGVVLVVFWLLPHSRESGG